MTPLPRKPSWMVRVLPPLTAASGVGYLATAYTISRWLTRPARARLFLPPPLPETAQDLLECQTADGYRLFGWAFTPARPRATIVLCHGLRNNRTQTLSRIEFLTQAGYRCVAFDHRAHGMSTGRITSFGFHERHDVHAIAGLVRERWPAEPCAALGISMGAAALCFAGPTAANFQALVLESLYHDLASAFQHRVGGLYPDWFRHFRRGIVWVTEQRAHVRLAKVAPANHVARLAPSPLLLMTGSLDPYAPPEEVRQLATRCRGPREVHIIPGATHTDVLERGGDTYRRLVLDFLERTLQPCRVL